MRFPDESSTSGRPLKQSTFFIQSLGAGAKPATQFMTYEAFSCPNMIYLFLLMVWHISSPISSAPIVICDPSVLEFSLSSDMYVLQSIMLARKSAFGHFGFLTQFGH
jgi:hypothetical protein